jgi:DNA-binding PucR family transcriptional regulator
VPAAVRGFVEDDARQGRVLSDTLLAYVECDLSVKLAAERLFVHPNTAHYRLAKIEDRTGCNVRRLADVQLLTIAIRLQRGAGAT